MLEIPLFQVLILHSPLLHLVDRPVACRLEIGRSRQAGTIHIRELMDQVHDLRIVRRFPSNSPVHFGVDLLFRDQTQTA